MGGRNAGSVSSLTGITPPGTPMTPTKGGAEKEAGKVQMQIQQLANDQERVQRKTFTNLMNKYPKQKKRLETKKPKIQAGIVAGKGLQKKWNYCTRAPKYFGDSYVQWRDTHETTAQKDVKQKKKRLETKKPKIQAGIVAGKGLQKKWNYCTRAPKYFGDSYVQWRDTHETTAQKDVKQKKKRLETKKPKIQAGIVAGKGLQKKWNYCTRAPKYFGDSYVQWRDTHETTAQKDVKQKKKRLETKKPKIQAGIVAGKGLQKKWNYCTRAPKYFGDSYVQWRDTHETTAQKDVKQKKKRLETKKPKIQAGIVAGKGLQKKWNYCTRAPKYFGDSYVQWRDTHETTAQKDVKQKKKRLETKKPKIQAGIVAGKGLQKKWNYCTRAPKYFGDSYVQWRDTHETTAQKDVKQKKKRLETKKPKIQAGIVAGKGLQKKWNYCTRAPKYFGDSYVQWRDTHETTAQKDVKQKKKRLETKKTKIQAGIVAGKGLQKKWNYCTRAPKYFGDSYVQWRDTHEKTAQKDVKQKKKRLETKKPKIQAGIVAGKGLQKKWNYCTRAPKYFGDSYVQWRDTHEKTAQKDVKQKKKRLETKKPKIQAGIVAGKGLQKKWNYCTRAPKYFGDSYVQWRDTHEKTAQKDVKQKKKRLETKKPKIQTGIVAGKGLQKKWNYCTRAPKYFGDSYVQWRDTHEKTAQKDVKQKMTGSSNCNTHIIETNRKSTCQYCDIGDADGKMNVQDHLDTIVVNDYLHKRTQDISTVELSVDREIRIVLIGRKGSGKSATGNTILGKTQFESEVSATSVTSKCRRGETIQAGKKVIVVDTPGLFDTGMTNENVFKEIMKCISMTSPGPHAMVLVVGIGRFTKEEQDTVQHFVKYFGEGMLKYMIVLFTRQDELSKTNQSIHQYVDSVPNELKQIFHQCENRYIAFNNDAVGQTQREQVSQFFSMVDLMLTRNGRSCYTNELYAEAEVTLQRRMHHQKEILEKEKQQENDEITSQLEKEFEQDLEKVILEKSRLEEELKSMNIKVEQSREDRSSMGDRRYMRDRVDSFQQQLHDTDKGNIERERERLQRDVDELNRKYEKKLEEKNKEIREHRKKKETEYEIKMNSENLRTRERDNIENENGGALDDLYAGARKLYQAW